jgi:hypothetical protein
MCKCETWDLLCMLAVDQGDLGASLEHGSKNVKLGERQLRVVSGELNEEVHAHQ